MDRRTFIVSGLTAATAGCLGSADDRSGQSVTDDATIEVAATGHAEEDPDMAIVYVAVEATGEDADEVRDDLATESSGVQEALLGHVSEDAITTDRYDIRERNQGTGSTREPTPTALRSLMSMQSVA